MRKGIAFLIVMVMVIGMLPFAAAEYERPEPRTAGPDFFQLQGKVGETVEQCVERAKEAYPDAEPEKIKARCRDLVLMMAKVREEAGAQGVDAVTTRLRKCVEFMQQHDVTVPEAKCQDIIEGHLRCVDYLKDQGVDDAAAKCDRLGIALGLAIARKYAAPEDLAEWQKKTIDKAIEDSDGKPDLSGLDPQLVRKFAYLTRAQQQKLLGMDEAGMRKYLAGLTLQTVGKDDAFKRREIAKQLMQQAEERYRKAKQAFEEAKGFHDTRKDAFMDAKRLLQQCEESGEDCSDLEERILERARDYLSNSIGIAIEHLSMVLEKINSAEEIDPDDAEDMAADLEDLIDALEELQDEAEAAETKEDIQEVTQQLEALWQKAKARASMYAGRLINDKVGEIVQRSEHLEDQLECAMDALEEQGIDVEGIDSKLDEFSMRVADAREKFELADQYYDEARDLKDSGSDGLADLVRRAKALVAEAHSDLKLAHTLLVSIVKDIKDAGGDLSACQQDEVVVVEEEDEDEEESGDSDSSDDEHECATDADCEEGEYCSADLECEDLEEDEEEAEDECTEDADCEAGEYCSEENECEDLEEDEEEAEDECATDADCEEGEYCSADLECEDLVNQTGV
ncbi:hypothetical protein JXB02_06335 [Candidatus Woesearchaeota archaeon]|nr:hypothetical protein [Candidatus Woesearchaeota archaeon]